MPSTSRPSPHPDTVRTGRIKKEKQRAGTKQSEKRPEQTPLTDPGYLLKVVQQKPRIPRGPWNIAAPVLPNQRENITRTIRVPTTITFHELHNIFLNALGWNSTHREHLGWSGEDDYIFNLHYDKQDLQPARQFMSFTSPREMLSNRDREPNSKSRTLAQVFGGGSPVWPEIPTRVGYGLHFPDGESEQESEESYADSDDWVDDFMGTWIYYVHFLGETDLTLPVRPGQEVFCTEGTGYLEASDLTARVSLNHLGSRHNGFRRDHINDILQSWCSVWRAQQRPSSTVLLPTQNSEKSTAR